MQAAKKSTDFSRSCLVSSSLTLVLPLLPSQFNIHMAGPSFNKVTSLHFATWKRGLKTGIYYLRTRPAADAIQFTVDQEQEAARALAKSEPKAAPSKSTTQAPTPAAATETKKADGELPKENLRELIESAQACPLDPKERANCLSCGS